MYSNNLLELLQADVKAIILQAEQLRQQSTEKLTQEPAVGIWSVAQVLEHLNFYNSFYIAAIEAKLHLHQSSPSVMFKPGWLGNYFVHIMKPAANNVIAKKMKSPKNVIPASKPDATNQLSKFITHQYHLLNLLQVSKTANLNALRIPTSLSRLITLKLGDTFRFFIAHEQRHFVQIKNTLSVMNALLQDRA